MVIWEFPLPPPPPPPGKHFCQICIPKIFSDDVVKSFHIFLVVQGCHNVADLKNNVVIMFVNLQVKR